MPLPADGMATPHDDLFHHTFQHGRHAAGWLAAVLPRALANALDWSTLRPAPEKVRGHDLRLHVTDPVFVIELLTNRRQVFLLIEHKSSCDRGLHDQLLRYSVHLANSTRSSASPPTLVVPILVYHGPTTWPAHAPPHPHLERLDPSAAEQLEQLRPRVQFLVDDLTLCTEAELRRPDQTALAQLTRLCLAFLPRLDAGEAVLALDRWADLLRAADRDEGPPPGSDAVAAIAGYTLRVTKIPTGKLHETFERILQRPEETIMSTAENLIREGLERGRTEGRAEGRADMILRLMEKRFGLVPNEVVQCVRSASIAELDLWADRILDAKAMDDLFAD